MVNNHVTFVTVQAVTSRLKLEWLLRLVVNCDVTTYGTVSRTSPSKGLAWDSLVELSTSSSRVVAMLFSPANVFVLFLTVMSCNIGLSWVFNSHVMQYRSVMGTHGDRKWIFSSVCGNQCGKCRFDPDPAGVESGSGIIGTDPSRYWIGHRGGKGKWWGRLGRQVVRHYFGVYSRAFMCGNSSSTGCGRIWRSYVGKV